MLAAVDAAEEAVGADWTVLAWGLGVGLVAAVVLLLFMGRVAVGASPLPAAVKYSFTDSWATNATAFVALVSAVGAASGELSAVVDEKVANAFSVSSALNVALAGLAPLWYTCWQSRQPLGGGSDGRRRNLHGTKVGLMGAAFFSVWGATAGVVSSATVFLVGMKNSSPADFGVILITGAVCVLLVVYAVRSLVWAGAVTEGTEPDVRMKGVVDTDGRLFLL